MVKSTYKSIKTEAKAVALHNPEFLKEQMALTRQNGKNILWYPDRKFFLLGKDVK